MQANVPGSGHASDQLTHFTNRSQPPSRVGQAVKFSDSCSCMPLDEAAPLNQATSKVLTGSRSCAANQNSARAPRCNEAPGKGAMSFSGDACCRASSSSRLVPRRKKNTLIGSRGSR